MTRRSTTSPTAKMRDKNKIKQAILGKAHHITLDLIRYEFKENRYHLWSGWVHDKKDAIIIADSSWLAVVLWRIAKEIIKNRK